MATKRASIAFAVLLCVSAPARAQWAHVVQACGDAAKQNTSASAPATGASTALSIKDLNTQGAALVSKWDKRYPWEDCVLKLKGLDRIAPVFGSLGTGGGMALGARSEQEINNGRVQSLLTGRVLMSFNGSYIAEGHYDIMMPAIGQWNAARATFEDQIIISPFVRRSDLHSMPFYGLGPSTSASAKIEYREQRTEGGVIGSAPVASWLAAGGGVTYLAPAIDQVSQPHFLDSQVFVRLHTPTKTDQTVHRHEARLTYDAFSDRESSANSFRRLQLFALESYELRRPITDPFANRSWFQNFLCQPIVGDECRAGWTRSSPRPSQARDKRFRSTCRTRSAVRIARGSTRCAGSTTCAFARQIARCCKRSSIRI
jgi:hypothetical protein